jgi:hypothetical protein
MYSSRFSLHKKIIFLKVLDCRLEGIKINVEIRKLTPDLLEDYLYFFENEAHEDNEGIIILR